jgi:hypothetical protein
MGELRQRRRLALPVLAGLGGLIVPVGIYLAFNHGPAAGGWGTAMSTDTAFALGMLALTRPRFRTGSGRSCCPSRSSTTSSPWSSSGWCTAGTSPWSRW